MKTTHLTLSTFTSRLLAFISLSCIMMTCFALDSTAQEKMDVVHLKDSSRIYGRIMKQVPNESVTIKAISGLVEVYSMDRIEKIESMEVEPSIRDYRKSSYTELGINLGTPAGVNLALGYWFGEFGLRASGMVLGFVQGFQGNVGFKLSDNANRSHVLALIFGKSSIEDKKVYLFGPDEVVYRTWSYFGLVYELNWHGFFLEAGFTAGSGDFRSPQVAAQLGYMYRFLP